ncbi:MAG: metal-binding protein [Mucilaginibacter polytrichastri]|nr:metal-binding protein [Mucilaginibacter polytrichastri]
MIRHSGLVGEHLRAMIRSGAIKFGGNRKLKIYGALHCRSGMRMHRANRVFFRSVEDARQAGYRPCAHCCYPAYKKWKAGNR